MMNFLDAYDVASPSTPVPGTQSEQTLNEEVSQVVGQLSRFWGGFRKQSQTALEAARKDLGQVVSQAQKEIIKFTSDSDEPASSTSTTAAEDSPASEADITDESSSELPEDRDAPTTPTPSTSTASGHARTASQNLFSRLQASLPPNLVSTVQNQLPESFKHAPGSIDFTQLRTTLTSEFQRVQGITRTQAEEYVQKSEGLLREAGEFLKDAVKVVPPEEGSGGTVAPAGALWDGNDIWMLPEVGMSSGSGKGKEKERSSTSSRRPSADGLRAVATRAESLLKQLRHDPEVIQVDPGADERAREMYETWKREKVTTKDGGINGEEWNSAIQKALDDPVDGQALKTTMDTLVPSLMTSNTFWQRYFFRVYQVEQEEERRKALIQGTVENDEDFSWEDDEDEPVSPTNKLAQPTQEKPNEIAGALPARSESASNILIERALSGNKSSPSTPEAVGSRRQSSEDSYDVVSSQVSNNGEPPKPRGSGKQEEDGSEESDWE